MIDPYLGCAECRQLISNARLAGLTGSGRFQQSGNHLAYCVSRMTELQYESGNEPLSTEILLPKACRQIECPHIPKLLKYHNAVDSVRV